MENKANRKPLINLTLSAMFIAIGLVLPFVTGQIPQLGKMLLPMHIPVFLCGLICGWQYGFSVGLILPLMRSFIFGMPVMFPSAVAMAVELAVYGLVAGYLYNHSRWKCIISLYRSMLIAMVAGRAVWGITMIALMGIKGGAFTLEAFFAGAFLNAFPGIILQLIFIPAVMIVLNRTGLVRFSKHHHSKAKA